MIFTSLEHVQLSINDQQQPWPFSHRLATIHPLHTDRRTHDNPCHSRLQLCCSVKKCCVIIARCTFFYWTEGKIAQFLIQSYTNNYKVTHRPRTINIGFWQTVFEQSSPEARQTASALSPG